MNGPLKWYGGKSHLANWIHSLEPADYTHRNIVFGGGLGEFWNWRCGGISEAVNDSNIELANFYYVLRDDFKLFKHFADNTPFAESTWKAAKEGRLLCGEQYIRAWRFFVTIRQSRMGLGRDFATPTRRVRRGMNENVSAWLSAVEGLPDVHERLKRVEIRNLDFAEFITKYDHDKALFYCDPPYLHGVRSTTGEYGSQEMSEEQHAELLYVLGHIKGKFMLSGYSSVMYHTAEAMYGWKCHTKEVDNHASSAKIKERKIECIWTNYGPSY